MLEFSYIDLPKFSKIVISGKDVTPEQASEIILRTSDLEFTCNDHEWRRKLHSHLDLIPDENSHAWYFTDCEKSNKVKKELGILDLHYLHNNQIASCYMGGPHGWCSWDGTIGCEGYNIGKWPSVNCVYKEWQQIAEAWPFLKLRCQLWNEEEQDNNYDSDEDGYGDQCGHRPIVEFLIKDGKVIVREPKGILSHYNRTPIIGEGFLKYGGERGCTFMKFKEAVELSRKSVQLKNESN